jgi:hypothetical protein
MKKILLPLIAVCCLVPAVAFAGHPLATDAAETLEPKKIEAETAVEFILNSNEGVKKNAFIIQETLSAGIMPKLDGFLSMPFWTFKEDGTPIETNRATGLGDVTTGVKYNFLSMDNVTFAVKPFIVMPIGNENKGLGEGGFGFGVVGVLSAELDKHISVDGNISFRTQGVKGGEGGEDYNLYGASVAGKYEATNELKIVGEFTASKPDVTDAKWATYLTAGAVYALNKNIDVDCGLRFGITSDASDDIGFLFGLNYKF